MSDFTIPDQRPLFFNGLRSGGLREVTYLRIWDEFLFDSQVDDFVGNCRKLETIELCAPRITGVFIVGLLTAPESRVKRLVLKDCTNVSPDTYAWARERGVTVERTTTEAQGGSGRRVYGLN